MKIYYSNKELVNLGWATIGGRIEDYIELWKISGRLAAAKKIKKDYDKDAPDVYRGLIVAYQYGIKFYYKDRTSIKNLKGKRK